MDELRLLAHDRDGALRALSATRINIAYLTGLAPEAVEAACIQALADLPPDLPLHAWPAWLDTHHPTLPAPARMLLQGATADAATRSLPHQAASTPTNQTLFWCPDATLLARAEAYIARGFTDLKLRIGIATWPDDLRRFTLLRERWPAARLAVDANGTWPLDEAPRRAAALARLGCAYIEQPLPPHAWAETAALSHAGPPIMLDESLDTPAAIERLARDRAAPLAHLKLAKLGGTDHLVAAARRLQNAGIGVMIGQMNEGAPSTRLAAQAAIDLNAPWRELYGADGLVNEPATPPLAYHDGALHLPATPLDQPPPADPVWTRPA